MNIKIIINDIPADLIFEESNNLMEIKILSQLNTLIYASTINKDNEMIKELVSHSWIPTSQLSQFRIDLEKHIIENI